MPLCLCIYLSSPLIPVQTHVRLHVQTNQLNGRPLSVPTFTTDQTIDNNFSEFWVRMKNATLPNTLLDVFLYTAAIKNEAF